MKKLALADDFIINVTGLKRIIGTWVMEKNPVNPRRGDDNGIGCCGIRIDN